LKQRSEIRDPRVGRGKRAGFGERTVDGFFEEEDRKNGRREG